MAYKRAQNVVAESKATLPLCFIVMCVGWWKAGYAVPTYWVQGTCLLLSVYLLEVVNDAHGLLRVESRMTGALFLLLEAAAVFLLGEMRTGIIQLCMTALLLTLFYSYEKRESSGWVYYSFLCLGLASMVFAKMLYYVPLLWILLMLNLRSLNIKSFIASLLGIITPYWFAAGWYIYEGELQQLLNHWADLSTYAPPFDYSALGEHQWLVLGWSTLLALIGMIHYARQGYHDNIRTRMFHNVLIAIDVATLLFLYVQPQHYEVLLPLHIVCMTPFTAHFLTLTSTWLTNIAFFLILLVTLAISAYHLWMPSSNFLSAMVIGAFS